MNQDMMLIFMIAIALFGMQAFGGFWQIKNYKDAMRRLHKKGNVGIGQKKGRFFNGHIVIIACDSQGIITGCEVLDGMSFLSKFHSVDKLLEKPLIGRNIEEPLVEINSIGKRKKYYKGYVNALEALQLRLNTQD